MEDVKIIETENTLAWKFKYGEHEYGSYVPKEKFNREQVMQMGVKTLEKLKKKYGKA